MDINKLPIVGAKEGQKLRYVIQYTLEGEVLCKKTPVGFVPEPLRTVDLAPGFDLPAYVEPISRIWALLCQIRKHDPERQVPLPVSEIKRYMICSKGCYKEMVDKGLLKEVLIPIIDTKTSKNLGSRRVFFFTPQGRAFVRKYIDNNYCLTENR
jgi:hypothetical protein